MNTQGFTAIILAYATGELMLASGSTRAAVSMLLAAVSDRGDRPEPSTISIPVRMATW
jgi:hypothetical protein